MEWSPEQDRAMQKASEWLRTWTPDKPVFRLFGEAGTGKSTLARELANGLTGKVSYAAFTGKAAHVMHQKGCPGATTIHKLIYKPMDKSKDRLIHLQDSHKTEVQKIVAEFGKPATDPDVMHAIASNRILNELKELIKAEQEGLKQPAFVLNPDSELRRSKLLIVDECSMVDEKMAMDLLSFEVPVLVLGDPAQLPPVRGTGWFINADPDIMLREIHRQARDNPIIRMARAVRKGEKLEDGDYGESRVISLSEGTPELYTTHSQVLVGREKRPERNPDPVWRANVNRRIRALLGRSSELPVAGDKLVCLRNNHDVGLLNGGQWKVRDSIEVGTEVGLTLESDDDSSVMLNLLAHKSPFLGAEVEFWKAKDAEHFDYGYAMTVHKAQGSQWDSVLLFDQSGIFRQEASRWLYTGITRAAKRITIVRC